MGCDIHLHIEVKIDGEWHHYSAPRVQRDYQLFEKMAGVRGDVSEAISSPKGTPEDATYVTKHDRKLWGIDGHSASWLSSAEIRRLYDWLAKHGEDLEMDTLNCYLFGNSFAGPGYRDDGVEDVRFVFWFDN